MSIADAGKVLMDTGFFVAMRNIDDDYHESAVDTFEMLRRNGKHLVTSDYVLDEAVTVTWARTKNKREAIEVGKLILGSTHVSIDWTDETLVRSAFELLQKYEDKSFSFTDCLLLALAKRNGIPTIVTCEDEFEKIGDGPEVIRLKKG